MPFLTLLGPALRAPGLAFVDDPDLAGARITAGYPFAPLAPHCPVSIALYGYDGRLWIGIDADGTAMPDVEAFAAELRSSFAELVEAALGRSVEA